MNLDRASDVDALSPPSEAAVAQHLLPDTASVSRDGRLEVGGIDVLHLADELGTPLFLYDEDHLRQRAREAVRAFGDGVAYATKAFLCKAMARLAIEEGMSLDVSTIGEIGVALSAGVAPSRLVLHGNNKSSEELRLALQGFGRIVIDSFDEIERLRGLLEGRATSPAHVLVRVNPGVEAHTHEYITTGQEDSKFGFSIASGAADEAVQRVQAASGLALVGAHAHVGSQIFRLDSFEKAIERLVPFVTRHELGEVCVGGGLGVAYLSDEQAPTLTQWAAHLRSSCRRAGLPGHIRVTGEPGRAVVATAGMTLYRVGTVKELQGIRTYVAVDGGMSDNPRPVLYGSGYEAFLPRCPGAPRPYRARIVGKHCESGDVLVADARLPADLAIGDVLATPVTGAYGFAMASNYNRLTRPPVVFVKDGEAKVVVRRETIEDLLRLEEL